MKIGTHNSATSCNLITIQRPFKWIIDLFCKCQNRTIEEQLNDGVKLFNLQVIYYKNEWVISHGIAIYDVKLFDIITQIREYSNKNNVDLYITIGEDDSFLIKKNPEIFKDTIMLILDFLANSRVHIIHAITNHFSLYPYHLKAIIIENYWMRSKESGIRKWIPIPRLWAKYYNKLELFGDYVIEDFYNLYNNRSIL